MQKSSVLLEIQHRMEKADGTADHLYIHYRNCFWLYSGRYGPSPGITVADGVTALVLWTILTLINEYISFGF